MIDLESYVKNERERINAEQNSLIPHLNRIQDRLGELGLDAEDLAAVERVLAKAASAADATPVAPSERPMNAAPRRRRAGVNGHEAVAQPRKRVTKLKSALGEHVCAVLRGVGAPIGLEDIRLRLLEGGVETRNNHIKVALTRYLNSGEVVMYGNPANPAKQTFVVPRRSEEMQAVEEQPGPRVPRYAEEWPGST